MKRRTVWMPAGELEKWRKVMQSDDRRDYDDYGYRGTTVFCRSGQFDDGREFYLRIVTSITEGEPPWCECVFFEPGRDGTLHEAACTDVSDDLEGTWKAEIGGVEYRVDVKGLI